MWSALFGFVFKALSAIGLGFLLRQGGKTAQKLDDAEDTIEGVEKRDEIGDQVRRDGADAARKRMLRRDR